MNYKLKDSFGKYVDFGPILLTSSAIEYIQDTTKANYQLLDENIMNGGLILCDNSFKAKSGKLIVPVKFNDNKTFQECLTLITPILDKLRYVTELIIDDAYKISTTVTDYSFEWEPGCYLRLGKLTLSLIHDKIYIESLTEQSINFSLPFNNNNFAAVMLSNTYFSDISVETPLRLFISLPTTVGVNECSIKIVTDGNEQFFYNEYIYVDKPAGMYSDKLYINTEEHYAFLLNYLDEIDTSKGGIKIYVNGTTPCRLLKNCSFYVTMLLSAAYTGTVSGTLKFNKRYML